MSWITEFIGYLATAMLALSLLASTDLKFRWLNAFGCVFFITYGLLLGAWPVVFSNLLLLVINVYYLFSIYRRKEVFEVLPFGWDEPLVEKFTRFYDKDIRKYFPDPNSRPAGDEIRFLVLRNMDIAHMFAATREQDGVARVHINYTIPRYRDDKVERFILQKENPVLSQFGVHELLYDTVKHPKHRKLLLQLGFSADEQGHYRLKL